MEYRSIAKIVGIFLIFFSTSMLPPMLVSRFYHHEPAIDFIFAFIVTLGSGVLLWIFNRRDKVDLRIRDGFLVVVLFWFVLSLFGAIPFMCSTATHLSFTNAMFESVSGLTTTGASVLVHLDRLPASMKFYRQELQFIGGMGIIVLAVAIFPMLGIGGMQLFRAETPGPIKDAKLTPRIQGTAKILWFIYVGLTLLCMLGYWAAGMSFFDAMGESFSTVSTGGFSMHDASFGYYQSNLVNITATIFMFLGGTNFALHFSMLRGKSLKVFWRDTEFKCYVLMLLFVFSIVFSVLIYHQFYSSDTTTFFDSLFDTVSIVTTTGFTSFSFDSWPSFLLYLVIIAGAIGGCAASTSGGVKVLRMVLLFKQSNREINRLIHPNGIFTIKFGKKILPEHVVEAIWGYVGIFLAIFVAILLMLMATGLDISTAFSADIASLANVGAGIAGVADNFEHISLTAKWIMMVGMMLGRLEIFTILVLFSPAFWKR